MLAQPPVRRYCVSQRKSATGKRIKGDALKHTAPKKGNRSMFTAPTAILITPEADIVPISLPEDPAERQAVMRAVIRCDMYDVVALTSRLDMWIDDEGIYRHPVNKLATYLAVRHGFTWQPYHGPVLLTGGADRDGETLPLTPDMVRALLTSVGDIVT